MSGIFGIPILVVPLPPVVPAPVLVFFAAVLVVFFVVAMPVSFRFSWDSSEFDKG
jgi:hypothetical protein